MLAPRADCALDQERRERYIRLEEERLAAAETKRREAKKEVIASTTSYLFGQIAEQEARRKKEREDEAVYAASVKADADKASEVEEKRRALVRASNFAQRHYLNEQVMEQKAQAGRDPDASDMTALEASLNRGLLVSIVQHKYPRPHVLN